MLLQFIDAKVKWRWKVRTTFLKWTTNKVISFKFKNRPDLLLQPEAIFTCRNIIEAFIASTVLPNISPFIWFIMWRSVRFDSAKLS